MDRLMQSVKAILPKSLVEPDKNEGRAQNNTEDQAEKQLEPEEEQIHESTLKNIERTADGDMSHSIKKLGVNLYYHMDGKFYTFNKKSPTYFLGVQYSTSDCEGFEKALQSTLYFSYRDNFPPLTAIKDQRFAFKSDRGWGCMLRAGQMMLSEALKRNLFTVSGVFQTAAANGNLNKIVEYFLDSDENPKASPFSIHNISEEAFKIVKRRPGEWYTATDIFRVFGSLIDKYESNLPELNLRVALFAGGTIYEDQVLELAYRARSDSTKSETTATEKKSVQSEEEKISTSKNTNNNLVEEKHPHGNEEVKNQINGETDAKQEKTIPQEWRTAVLVVVLTKTGLEEHNEEYLTAVKDLLKFRQSVGLLSGKRSRAYYVVGRNEENLLFFDPHYVQRAPKNRDEIDQMMHTYLQKKCYMMKLRDMATSVAFGFYIENSSAYQDFKDQILAFKEKDPNFLLGFEDKSPPEPEIKEGDVIESHEDAIYCEDGFEIMS